MSATTEIAAERLQLLRDYEALTPRSLQKGIGWSAVGDDCSRYVWSHLHGVPQVNNNQNVLATLRGHAIHTYLEPAFHEAGWEVELPVEFAGIPGHVDLFRDGVVEDIKTGDGDKVRALRAYGPSRSWRWQVQGYARALAEQGRDVHTVRIVAYSVDSSEEVAVWQEPYDPSVADEAVARIAELEQQESPPAPGRDVSWCERFCPFYDQFLDKGGCPSRLLGDDVPELDDPELVAAVNDMRDAREDAKKAAERKAAASSVLYGLRGMVGEFQVRTVQREGSTTVDVDAVDWDAYEAIVGAVPMKTSNGSSYVSISRAKRAKR